MRVGRAHILWPLAILVAGALLFLVAWEDATPPIGFQSVSFAVFMVVSLGSGIVTLVGGVLLCFRKGWKVLAVGLLALGVLFASHMAAGRLTRSQVPRAIETAKPLIAAIERYETEMGKPPPDLDALVPGHLDDIPTCPIGLTGREYGYGTNGADWSLYFWTGAGCGRRWDRAGRRWVYAD